MRREVEEDLRNEVVVQIQQRAGAKAFLLRRRHHALSSRRSVLQTRSGGWGPWGRHQSSRVKGPVWILWLG
jgi:hypothetical protein